mmetsp:Transcript_33938/g.57314  ORF Transcript_33938/g.57314 Transcript_33938/m.57314 type:complete len:209 (-) Transcript_33938:221-847(-)
MGLLKKLGRKKGKNQSAAQKADDDDNAKNDNPQETEVVEPQAEPAPKEVKKTADELVAEMFSKQKLDDMKNHAAVSTSPKQTADERVAQMFAKSKPNNDSKPTVGKAIEQKKAIEALLQKQHDPKGFIDSKKGTKGEIAVASNSVNSFAERKKMAEALSQNKVVTDELKHTVDISAEDFGDKNSFAQRRKMLEAKSQGQNMPSATDGA